MVQTNTESIRLWPCAAQWLYAQSIVGKVRQSMSDPPPECPAHPDLKFIDNIKSRHPYRGSGLVPSADSSLSYYRKSHLVSSLLTGKKMKSALAIDPEPMEKPTAVQPTYDIYRNLQRAVWDSLMFFYGIIMCVGGLGAFGYLAIGPEFLYGGLGPT